MLLLYQTSLIENDGIALDRWLSGFKCHPVHQKACRFYFGSGHMPKLHVWFLVMLGHCQEAMIGISSLPHFLPLPLSLKPINICSGENLKKKKKEEEIRKNGAWDLSWPILYFYFGMNIRLDNNFQIFHGPSPSAWPGNLQKIQVLGFHPTGQNGKPRD